MADTADSPDSGPLEDLDDSQWQSQGAEDAAQGDEDGSEAGDAPPKPAIPLQKRRRVTRACDECRRKKIKCDGKQPCTHCTVYSYECTYDQPSNRRRNPAPQYIEALETRLNKAESLLRLVLPEVDLDDPKFEARGVEQILSMARQANQSRGQKKEKMTGPTPFTDEEAQLESMVERTGTLDLDDNGDWGYHGAASGFAFLKKLRAQMGSGAGEFRWLKKPKVPVMVESPRSASESPLDGNLPVTNDLPPKDIAKALCRNALDDCCALMRFVHQPTFYQRLDRIYSTDLERFTNTDNRFLALLYSVLAVGCLFSSAEDNRLDAEGYEKGIGQGYQFYRAGRQLVNITDCRELMGLQTICFMIVFLQASARLSTCYSYIGIALRTCLRLGMHRDVQGNFDPIEREQRIRTFWLVWKMDAYVGAMLGFPQMLNNDDVDQVHPTEVDDDRITLNGILSQPPNKFPLIKATTAHTKLVLILKKVMRYVYPIKSSGDSAIRLGEDKGYMISHSKIREIEGDLQVWMDELPMELRPSDDAPQDLARVQQLLRMAYAHVQMTMYRPFLHYSSNMRQNQGIDKRTFACAAACVSVARNIVHITTEMKKRGLLIGAYWFVMYTTYFAIVSLVFFCLENPHSGIANSEILKDAIEGQETLASLARRSLAADRCSASLEALFKDLPERMQQRRNASKAGPNTQAKKRSLPEATAEAVQAQSNASSPSVPTVGEIVRALPRARTFPHEKPTQLKRQSGPEQYHGLTGDSTTVRPGPQASWRLGSDSGTLTPESLQASGGHVQGSPHQPNNESQFDSTYLPDLKNVMFPSNNPFAYPNQPMSSLEANQFTPSEEQSNGSGFFIPNGMATSNTSYENISSPIYGNFAPFIASSQPHLMASQPGSYSGMPGGLDMSPMPQGGNLDIAHGNEEMWSQMGGGRTGFTPGINLDELFGNEPWTPSWDHGAGQNGPTFN